MEGYPAQENRVMSWLPGLVLALATLFFSMIGVFVSLVFIFALPDHTVQPWPAVLVFMFTALVVVALVLVFGRKNLRKYFPVRNAGDFPPAVEMVLKEGAADAVIKWLVLLFGMFFAIWGILIALICIYALPDQTVQPTPAVFSFAGGALVMIASLLAIIKTSKG
ncbi:MAG: hypothetical protein JEZ02_04350 [Desulfatibacillum sp.]|nr:hypothetical protein [Desulfatibacillum sp.]